MVSFHMTCHLVRNWLNRFEVMIPFKTAGTQKSNEKFTTLTHSSFSVALFTPHTAFSDPKTPEGAPLRESIELRFLVFYD